MRKIVALTTMSTVAVLGAMFTTAGAASAATLSAAVSSPGAVVQFDDTHAGAEGVTAQLDAVADREPVMSVGNKFEMEMMMNHFSQVVDMSTSVVGASNTSAAAMARGVKA